MQQMPLTSARLADQRLSSGAAVPFRGPAPPGRWSRLQCCVKTYKWLAADDRSNDRGQLCKLVFSVFICILQKT
jgi:hypothetical protein